MKVLFTGMSSSHCKPGKNETFFKTLARAYGEFSEVVWSEPKLSWTRSDLETFDEVVFGFSPPTSIGANYLYGAINVLNLLYESPKLKLVVDSQQIWQYKNSINSYKRDPDQIFGSFYAGRKNYNEARSGKIRNSAEALAEKLASIAWPKTLTPALPWSSSDDITRKLSFISSDSVVPVNLDALLLTRETPQIGRTNQWAADNVISKWVTSLEKTLRFPVISVKDGPKPRDVEAEQRINLSMGLIIAPQDRNTGTWWSYRLIQGLNTTTPIVTQWQESSAIGAEWSLLGYQIEDMQPYERQHVAFQQRRLYESSVPDRISTISKLKNLMIDFQPRGI